MGWGNEPERDGRLDLGRVLINRGDQVDVHLSAKSGAIVAPEAEHVHLVVLIQFFENDA
jgi:hypothetical protein